MKAKLKLLVSSCFLLISHRAFCFLRPHIFGKDDRRDAFMVSDSKLLEVAAASPALIPIDALKKIDRHFYSISAASFRNLYDLKTGNLEDRFANQPTAATCSGVLISDRHVLTAGHCLSNSKKTEESVWVFGYEADPNSTDQSLKISGENIYRKNRILEQFFHPYDLEHYLRDYAIVELDRPVLDRKPVVLNLGSRKDFEGVEIAMAGYPSGLPLKITDNAKIRKTFMNQVFSADLDAFKGNSGSPVFLKSTGEVIGILVRGPLSFRPQLVGHKQTIIHTEIVEADTLLTDVYDVKDIPLFNKTKPFVFQKNEVQCVMVNPRKVCLNYRVIKPGTRSLEDLDVNGTIKKLWNDGTSEVEWTSPFFKGYIEKASVDKLIFH
jgi:hypothetical protein